MSMKINFIKYKSISVNYEFYTDPKKLDKLI